MNDATEQKKPPLGAARDALLRRILDVVSMPASRIPPQDRQMAGDILLDMLFHADERDRLICSTRLAGSREAPRRLLRYLAQANFPVARPLLEESDAFDDCDLAEIIRQTQPEHRQTIARRRNLSVAVTAVLAEVAEPHIVREVLANRTASFAETTIDRLIAASRDEPSYCPLLVERIELKPSHAMAMFWWADGPTRRKILTRHAAERQEMISLCSDVFEMAAAEGWQDGVARKALQMIERRQRNRAAIARSPYDSLEHAVQAAAEAGMEAKTAQEIGYLSGIKPVTAAKILSDAGGEGLAVLCKATGLKREYLALLWRALGRPLEQDPGHPHPQFALVAETYEVLSVLKAQTTLRYWNWALSSAFSPAALRHAQALGDPANEEAEFSTAQRTARLVFGR
ncbi:DUF2336 domain-containing protein [Hyphomonas sp. WL0036]|jgi:uncharacterized protein (DUF2336 family)|uniref:DUF2336 domain-containing protein n=1 Tax=Hyphomonas sediminis TaxID=2866160 RepID=UPI001C800F5A|nr:DUF2336 domain-containing protein [Hyphomonas sediminis]MBY9065306.1 DUF2336 domain-containing protein [Hyphomonas sediminis]